MGVGAKADIYAFGGVTQKTSSRSTVRPAENSYAMTVPYGSTRDTTMTWSLTPFQDTRRR